MILSIPIPDKTTKYASLMMSIFIVILVFSALSSHAQEKKNIYYVFRSVDDYYNNHFIEADNYQSKYFRMKNEPIIMGSEVWGYQFNADVKQLVRWTGIKGGPYWFTVVISGPLCLYVDGDFKLTKNGELQLLFNETSGGRHFYLSKGLTGEIVLFNKADGIITDDPEFIKEAKDVTNVMPHWDPSKYINERVAAVVNYNKRHPEDREGFNMFKE